MTQNDPASHTQKPPSSSTLERLVYTSRSTEPVGSLGLFNLLNNAREKNARLNITGHLLYADGVFTQCFEGPTESIESLWNSLLKDPRHFDIEVLIREPIEQRRFPDWSMAFSSYKYLNSLNMPGFFPVDAHGVSAKSVMCA